MRSTIFLFLFQTALFSQQTVAPTREDVGKPNGENKGAYNILNSVEVGYRFRTVDGNYGKYRSDVNFGNGLRVLGSQLRIQSREGHGHFFDELSITTQGIGNDPYQSASLRVEKNGLYRYDMLWRLNEYYNPAIIFSSGLHQLDTRRRIQDHDFTLFPQGAFKLFMGYTRNSQTGPALNTIQIFDSRGDEFPLFMDVRRQRNEYRLGGEGTLLGFTLNVLHGWDNFKDDSTQRIQAAEAGNNPLDSTTLTSFRRDEPVHGNAPYWRLSLFRNMKRFAVNARYSNVSGRRNFLTDELTIGTDRLNSVRNRQFVIAGNGSRPVTNGSLNLTFLPTDRLTLTNHTAFSNVRMDGAGVYREINNSVASDNIRDFQFLGIRTIETVSDATLTLTKILGVYGGYHFSDRRIRSTEGETFGGRTDSFKVEQDNRLNAGLAGLRLRPMKPLTIQFDAELGRADKPFFPISEKNYHSINGRAQYKMKSFSLSALVRTLYNTNSSNLYVHSSKSRQASFDGSWTPRPWISFDAGYAKIHLDTLSGIAYFASGDEVKGSSIYISNLHSGNFGMHTTFLKKADLYIGYSIVRDAGDGRSTASVFVQIGADPQATQAFYVAQTFPLSFQSPQARFSWRLHNRLRWNLGYQHYAYREDFYPLTYQNYRAHTGYTSLLWSF